MYKYLLRSKHPLGTSQPLLVYRPIISDTGHVTARRSTAMGERRARSLLDINGRPASGGVYIDVASPRPLWPNEF